MAAEQKTAGSSQTEKRSGKEGNSGRAADIRVLRGRSIRPDLQACLRLCGDSEETRARLRRLEPQVTRILRPTAAAVLVREERALYVVLTLGPGADVLLRRLSAPGHELESVLAGTLADSALLAFDTSLHPALRAIALEQGFGIAGRIEEEDGLSRRACAAVDSARTLGVRVSDAGIMTPARTMALRFVLTPDADRAVLSSDCGSCPRSGDCEMHLLSTAAKASSTPAHSTPRPSAPAHLASSAQVASAPAPDSDLTVLCAPKKPGETLLTSLRRQGIALSAPCGGRGTCGKCRVQVQEGSLPVTPADRRAFSLQELARGWRLACQARPAAPVRLHIPAAAAERGFSALALQPQEREEEKRDREGTEREEEQRVDRKAGERKTEHVQKREERRESARGEEKRDFYIRRETAAGIAIDIGTTTLAAVLVQLPDPAEEGTPMKGEEKHEEEREQKNLPILASASCLNAQRSFGADVISRIQAAGEGQGMALRLAVLRSLSALLSDLAAEAPQAMEHVRAITIAANTTMEHLLMGWDATGLGSWPFTPISLGGETISLRDLLSPLLSSSAPRAAGTAPALPAGLSLSTPVSLLPGISTYVGADITAGLLSCGIDRAQQPVLFIDLGTNAEMALGNREHLLVTSTAAGPALEGAGLVCGTGSVPGAICAVRADASGHLHCRTIGDAPATGICGTGALEACAALLQSGAMDVTGKLREPFFSEGVPLEGNVRLYQEDIRRIQMAKGAIRAGIETLLLREGLRGEELSALYLCGGFGYHLDPRAAAAIGLIPAKLADRAQAPGNTALQGAVAALADPQAKRRLSCLREISEELVLGNDAAFEERYIGALNFPKS